MSGTVAKPEGITDPPIDSLLEKVESKYALVVYAAKRARQITQYNQQVANGMFNTPGPLIPTNEEYKPLSIALHEIDEGLLRFEKEKKQAEEQTEEAASEQDEDALAEAFALQAAQEAETAEAAALEIAEDAAMAAALEDLAADL